MGKMTRRAWAALAVAAASGLAACGGESSAEVDKAPSESDTIENRHVEFAVEGAFQARYQGAAPVRTLAMLGGTGRFEASNLLSMGLAEPVATEAGPVRIGMDISRFEKDGTFDIAPTGADGLPITDGPQNLSNVIVQQWLSTDVVNQRPVDFRFKSSGCTVTVREQGREGEVSCPHLEDHQGRAVSMTMRWEEASS